MNIHDFFSGRSVNFKELAGYLDGLSSADRIREATSLTAREQSALWDAAKDKKPVHISDFVPEGTPAMKQIIHHGKNSLPVFSLFQKRFCRSDNPSLNELWGYNHQTMAPVTGPGYFVASDSRDGEVLIDYLRVPPRKPDGWPTILPNSARLSRFVYYMTQDFMRGVSNHVTIGHATRKGKDMDNWFVLCRED